MNILIAMDSFKGSLTSEEAGAAASRGAKLAGGGTVQTKVVQMADGGEGTLNAVLSANAGKRVKVQVRDPLHRLIEAEYGVVEAAGEAAAVIECAAACGITLIQPSTATVPVANSYGFGQLIRHALDSGILSFILTLGGSAMTDGGAGMLQALGWKFLNRQGEAIGADENALWTFESVDPSGMHPALKESRITVASDVVSPLSGPRGAALVFGPQKGASPEQALYLDRQLVKLGEIYDRIGGRALSSYPGSGAAGGLGAALAALGAKLRPGFEVVAEAVRLEEAIRKSDVVFTGEGSLDRQSVMGKVPFGVGRIGKRHGKLVIGFAGRTDLELEELEAVLDGFFSIQNECRNVTEAMDKTTAEKQLAAAAKQVTRLLLRSREQS